MKSITPFIIVAMFAGAAFAQAQSSSADSLNAICSGLLAESPGGVSGDHAKLCACLARETPAQLDVNEMQAYAEASIANRAPPASVLQKITAIATKCLQEAQ